MRKRTGAAIRGNFRDGVTTLGYALVWIFKVLESTAGFGQAQPQDCGTSGDGGQWKKRGVSLFDELS